MQEINGSSKQLKCLVTKDSQNLHITLCLCTLMTGYIVHINMLVISAQISDFCIHAALLTLQVNQSTGIYLITTQ